MQSFELGHVGRGDVVGWDAELCLSGLEQLEDGGPSLALVVVERRHDTRRETRRRRAYERGAVCREKGARRT